MNVCSSTEVGIRHAYAAINQMLRYRWAAAVPRLRGSSNECRARYLLTHCILGLNTLPMSTRFQKGLRCSDAHFLLAGSGMSGLPGAGLTDECSQAFDRAPDRRSHLCLPDVEVPLPLLFGPIPERSGFAFCELAAGSPVDEPWPLGAP
jgi:hypothetical protein